MRQSTATPVFFVALDAAGNPKTGLVAADFLGGNYTAIKADGTKTDVALVLNTNLFEVDATKAPGLYRLIVAATENNQVGQFAWSLQPAAALFKGVLGSAEVTSILADIANVYSRLGAPAGASVSADIAAAYARIGAPAGASIAADVASTHNRIGAPVGASISADIAAVPNASRDATWGGTRSSFIGAGTFGEGVRHLYQAHVGHMKIVGTQLIIYAEDGSTPLKTFNLYDTSGQATALNATERLPT